MGLLSSIGSSILGSVVGTVAKDMIGGSLGSSIGSAITGGVSSALDYKTSLGLMEKQFELQKDLNKYNALNRYPWAVQSLKDAGLNPILAATQGQPLAGGSPQYNDVSPATRAINSARALQEMEAISANIDRTKADTQKSKAETLAALNLAGQYSASAAQMRANTAVVNKQLDYWSRNPDHYDLRQAYQEAGVYGIAGTALEKVFGTSANSAKSIRHGYSYGSSRWESY